MWRISCTPGSLCLGATFAFLRTGELPRTLYRRRSRTKPIAPIAGGRPCQRGLADHGVLCAGARWGKPGEGLGDATGPCEGPEPQSEDPGPGGGGYRRQYASALVEYFRLRPRGRETPYNLAGSKRTALTDSRSTSALMSGAGSWPVRSVGVPVLRA